MVGTAALPHILMRYYTTPSVRQARESVFWSLFFIFLLYFTAPALGVLAKFDVYSFVVGSEFAKLPQWVAAWQAVDPGLLSIVDVNKDGIVQLAEIAIGGDIIVLATPEIAGLPYVISGLVAAGGLAAALSTADGLLLTIANALSHDFYYKMLDPNASTARRVTISKILLLVVALIAATVAAQKPADILFLVSAAFSLAAAAFFPALVLGIFWKRANKWGATLGMIAGLGITFYYMATTQPWLRGLFGVTGSIADHTWWGIGSISAGLWGVPLGFIVIIIVSLLTPAPDRETQELVEHVRYPNLTGDTSGDRWRRDRGRRHRPRGPAAMRALFSDESDRAGGCAGENRHERQQHDRNADELGLGSARHVQHAPHAHPEEEQRVAQPDQPDDRHHRQQQRRAGEHHRNRAVGRDLERGEIVAGAAEHRRNEREDRGEDEDRADDRKIGRRAGRENLVGGDEVAVHRVPVAVECLHSDHRGDRREQRERQDVRAQQKVDGRLFPGDEIPLRRRAEDQVDDAAQRFHGDRAAPV